jgi:hypothetical protein
MRWAMRVALREHLRNAYKFWSANLKGRGYLGNLGADGRITLNGL